RPASVRQALRHDNDAERKFIEGVNQQLRWGWLCRIEWMTRLSFDVPAVISRWKQGNARRLRRVLWIFATCVPGAVWKRSAPLRTKRTELVEIASLSRSWTLLACWQIRGDSEIKRAQERGLSDYPVFTRKAMTDLCYAACTRKLLAARPRLYPQFATHNALTVASVIE